MSSDEIIKIIEGSGDYIADYLTPEGFETNLKNIVDQIVYNKNNLIIKDWLAGIIVTSTILYLIKEELYKWKICYDRWNTYNKAKFRAYTGKAYFTPYNKPPTVFSWPMNWGDQSMLVLYLERS